ncbi:MAG: CDGSH iron-sulfur domain-containing protein [Ignavibacteriae bacterium]|jgi:CDGSH-type Zn-finger protein|nr:CDGSH iron-sulfur domain-containing protein [Ignavibacteriota bacterium]NOG99231.1 CDGSH iron-sulfur domain-containing protein [Ignavibacteriota bacterium]
MQTNDNNNGLKITVLKNGPIMMEGSCKVEKQSGELIKEGDKLFLCRCSHSSNKPFCDGAHKKAGFIAD